MAFHHAFYNINAELLVSYLNNSSVSLRNKQIGKKLCDEDYIHDVKVATEGDRITIASRCYRSIRKTEKPHSHVMIVDTGGSCVTDSSCSCTAGIV